MFSERHKGLKERLQREGGWVALYLRYMSTFLFLSVSGVFSMEEEHHEPPVPRDGIPVEVVDLTAAVGPFQSMLFDGHDAIESEHSHLHTPRADERIPRGRGLLS